MSEVVDLWPDFQLEKLRTPLSILREQADLLEKKTNNLLKGELLVFAPGDYAPGAFEQGNIGVRFLIIATYLRNYKYNLFELEFHPAKLYPVVMDDKDFKNEEELIRGIQKQLASEETKQILLSLYSQSLEESKISLF